MVPGSNPGGGEIFGSRPDQPRDPPNLLYSGYLVFTGDNAAGFWRSLPTPSSAEVKESVQLYLYSPFWDFVVCSSVDFAFNFTFFEKTNKPSKI